jgi:hypothetical protein
MATITTRAGKGSPLTNTEVDDNFSNLNSAKYESGSSPLFVNQLYVQPSDSNGTNTTHIAIGHNRTGNGYAHLDFVGDATWSDYGFRIMRNNNGPNASTSFNHNGTGDVRWTMMGGSNAFVINDGSHDSDFRVESNDNANMLFVDAANNKVGIGVSPSKTLDVNGTVVVRTGGSTPEATVANYSSGLELTGGNMRLNIDVSNVSNGGSYLQTRHKASAYPNAYYNLNLNPLGGSVIINEEGNSNSGFRVESDSNTHMLFVDSLNDRVLFGSASNIENNRVQVTAPKTLVAGIPQLSLGVNDSTAMAEGVGGAIDFTGQYHTNGSYTSFASVEAYKTNATSGNYDGTLVLKARKHGGDQVDKLRLNHSEAVFNEDGLDTDFRVESSNTSNMFVVDAGTDQVLIGQTHLSDSVPSLQMGTSRFLAFHNGLGTAGVYNSAMGFSATVDTSSAPAQMVLPAGRNTHGGSVIFSDYEGVLRFSTLDDASTDAATGGLYANQRLLLSDTDVVVNDEGNDTDFRVESNYTASALAVDGDTGAVEIGTGIIGRGVTDNFTLNGKTQPHYGFNLNPDSGVNIGISGYYGISFATAGSERLAIAQAGTAVFNDIGADADFRVESDTNAQALFVDASENVVVFGNTAVNLASGYANQTGVGVHANDGYVQISSDSTPLTLGRTTVAGRGAHIVWRNASAVVGEIGDYNGVPYIGYTGGAGGGLMFNGSSIEPTAIGNARTNGANDIGSGNYRWRNGMFSNTVQAKTFERLWTFADLTALDSGWFYPVSLDGGSASTIQSFELFKYYGSNNGSTGLLGSTTLKMDMVGYSWGGNPIHNYVHHAASNYRCMVGAVTMRGYYVPVIWLRGGFGYHWTSTNPNISLTIHTSNTSYYSGTQYGYTIGRITDSVMQGKPGYLGLTHHTDLGHEDHNCNNWYT